mgnify:CR=1 FL=1
MKTENNENDWNLENHPSLATEDNHYFDEEPQDKDPIEEQLENKLWLLLCQLSQVGSPAAGALFYVLSGSVESKTKLAEEYGVGLSRFSQLVSRTMEDLAKSKQYKQIEDDEEIIFWAPTIRKKTDKAKHSRKKKNLNH